MPDWDAVLGDAMALANSPGGKYLINKAAAWGAGKVRAAYNSYGVTTRSGRGRTLRRRSGLIGNRRRSYTSSRRRRYSRRLLKKGKKVTRKSKTNVGRFRGKRGLYRLKKSVAHLSKCKIVTTKIQKRVNYYAPFLLTLNGNVNNNFYTAFNTGDITQFLNTMQIYEPAGAAVVTNNLNTGTYQQEFLFRKIICRLRMRNNYVTDVRVRAWLCQYKKDSNNDPITVWNTSQTDVSNAPITTRYSFPSDGDTMRDNFTLKKVLDRTLKAGDTAVISYNINDMCYDPSDFQAAGSTYMRKFKSAAWIVQIEGNLVHDVVAGVPTSTGTNIAGLDVERYVYMKCDYDGGFNRTYIENNIPAAPVMAGGYYLEGQKSIPQNITYSYTNSDRSGLGQLVATN